MDYPFLSNPQGISQFVSNWLVMTYKIADWLVCADLDFLIQII